MVAKKISVRQILKLLDLDASCVLGEMARVIDDVAPIHEATSPRQLAFCALGWPNAAKLTASTMAGVVLCASASGVPDVDLKAKTILLVDDPRFAFMRIMEEWFSSPVLRGVHRTAVIDKSAKLGRRLYIGPFAYIGPGVRIGDDSVIYGRVCIYGPTIIGRRCVIQTGAIIGEDGFGFWRNKEGKLDKFPHRGGVEIGDDVEIGANTTVDRGALGWTGIGRGAKIDNLVHVGHNVRVGEDCVITAQCLIAGSAKIGARCWIAPCACIRNWVEIGEGAFVGLGAVVTKSVAPGETVMGVPARPRAEFLKRSSLQE
jgi:UDP-3-O-[3-hydroxymyristoyl] glucosamine N-acyltransferase